MPLGAGQFDQRITIEEKSVTRASNGEEIVAWVTHLTCSARVQPLRGREFFAAAQMQGAADYRVTIRYRPTIRRDMRVIWRGQVLDIAAEPIDVNGGQRDLELMCVAGVKNG